MHDSLVLTSSLDESPRFLAGTVASKVASFTPWMAICIAWAGMLAFDNRYVIDPDGISYIDMATQTLQHGPASLINGLWSPAYPAVLAAAIGIFHPAPENVIPLAHFVNWILFIAATFTFAGFLRALLPRDEEGVTWHRILVPVSFGVFFWFISQFIDVGIVKPDLLGTIFVLEAAGICLRAARSKSWWRWIALGAVIAAAYYTRAAMLPLGLALFVFLLLFPLHDRARGKTLLALASFVLLSLPLIKLTSDYVGHLSTGEAGRLNYLWYVHGLEPIHAGWTGDRQFGNPLHGPQLLQANPRVITWKGAPVPGTYPLWYDASYFHAGAAAPFSLKQQLNIFGDTLPEYFAGLQQMSPLVVAAVALLFSSRGTQRPLSEVPRSQFWIVLWFFAACALFALVHVETRYYAAFAVVFWTATLHWCSRWSNRRIESVILPVAVLILLLPMVLSIPAKTTHLVAGLTGRSPQPGYRLLERRLLQLGLKPGDSVAAIGNAAFNAYGVETAGMRFISEAPNRLQFWRLSTAERQKVIAILQGTGAKAVLAHDSSPYPEGEGWELIPGSDYKVLLLR